MSVEEVDWGWGSIPSPVVTTTPDPIKPVWEQPQAQDDDLAPKEWTIIWLRWEPTGPRETSSIVKMSRVKLEEHLQQNISFRVTDSDGRKGNIPASRVIFSEIGEDDR